MATSLLSDVILPGRSSDVTDIQRMLNVVNDNSTDPNGDVLNRATLVQVIPNPQWTSAAKNVLDAQETRQLKFPKNIVDVHDGNIERKGNRIIEGIGEALRRFV
eukprot:gb/GECG01011071.1/.p1 GENE.gb/GECG01011071.1/~~gb/GECG01011071.1/.p1  ORF type:complete len:104 (+),score=7.90 gb/GECG01011071.1/:1-312(+)